MRPRSAWLAVAIFFAALAPRLWVAHAWAPEPTWDGAYYHEGAQNIAAGLGYVGHSGKAWCHYPVGYSALLGGVYALFGDAPIVGKRLGAALGALLAALVFLLARRSASERRAVLAGVLVAIHPGLVAYAALHMTELASAVLIVAAALVAGEGPRRVGAGLVLGLATLVRPQSLLLAPLVGLFGARRLRPMIVAGTIATAVAVLTVVPWTVRNCRVMDGCAFVSTNGGWNLAIGSFPRATGRYEELRPGDGCHIITGQVQQDRCWMRLGLGFIADDPGRWVAMIPQKLAFTFDHESFPIGYVASADPARWPERDRALGRGILSWSHRLLLTLAALAMLPRPSRRRPRSLILPFALVLYAWFAAWTPPHPFWPLTLAICLGAVLRFRHLAASALYTAAATASLVVVHAVFFGEDRYHLVVTPLFCLLAATAWPVSRSAAAS